MKGQLRLCGLGSQTGAQIIQVWNCDAGGQAKLCNKGDISCGGTCIILRTWGTKVTCFFNQNEKKYTRECKVPTHLLIKHNHSFPSPLLAGGSLSWT